jgi:hypothetical protein
VRTIVPSSGLTQSAPSHGTSLPARVVISVGFAVSLNAIVMLLLRAAQTAYCV